MRSLFVLVVAPVVFLLPPLGATPGLAQGSAPGAPIFDCTNAAARYERMGRGLDVQREFIRRQQALFDGLRAQREAGSRAAREELMARNADLVRQQAAEQLEVWTMAKERALELPAPSDPTTMAKRFSWLKKVSALQKKLSDLKNLQSAFGSGYRYATEVQSRSHSLPEHLKEVNNLFVESKLAETIGGELAQAGGPVGIVLFEGSLQLLDQLVAAEGYWDRFLEEQWAADNLNAMKGALSDVEVKMANLKKDCPADFGEDGGNDASLEASLTAPPPESPAVESAEASANAGGKVALVAVGAGVAVAGGLYAGKVLGDLAATSTSTSSSACVSNRFCIVNSLSSGCSCSGSVNGQCGWTGDVAGSNQGCGAGLPCDGGLSCNNGRCEGRGGRCPF